MMLNIQLFRKYFFVIIVAFVFGSIVNASIAQELVTRSALRDSIKVDGVNFAIEQGDFEKHGNRDEYLKRIYFFEINDEQALGYSDIGIYLFTITTSHTERYILILNKNKWRYYELENLQRVLLDACQFFSDNDVSDDKIIKYLETISSTYRYNLTLK